MTLKTAIMDKVRKLLVKGCDQWVVKFDPTTGKFLEKNGGWAVTNQDNIFLLAYLYQNDFEGNHYYKDPNALNMIKAGGNALRAAQREDGQVLFVKPDGSEWGYIYMPWSMFHWLQTYDLMQGHLDQETLEHWKQGLILAYDGIRDGLKSMHIHNIQVWDSAAIYRAGVLFDREDYKEIADKMIEKTISKQHPDGFWPEFQGPTLSYNGVYIYALGVYKFYGGRVNVDGALQKAFSLQRASVYPDGTLVETADGRVKYDGSVRTADLIGYLELEGGYEYVDFILDKVIKRNQILSDRNVNLLRYLERLPEPSKANQAPIGENSEMKLCHGNIQILRKDGWQVNLSSYTSPLTDDRWGMDRQMFVSVWHKDAGLLIGGGNTKYIPEWGTFCIHDGERILYVPDKGVKNPDENEIILYYEDICCKVKIKELSEQQAVLEFGYESTRKPDNIQIGLPMKFSCDPKENDFSMNETVDEHSISFRGYEISFTNSTYKLKWPVEPFNPYEAQGRSPAQYWAAVLNIDITAEKGCTVWVRKK